MAEQEVLTLNESTPQIEAPQTGNTYKFPRAITSVVPFGVAGSSLGSFTLSGNTSGTITVRPAAAAGTWTFTLPTGAGTAGWALVTDGSGTSSWSQTLTNPLLSLTTPATASVGYLGTPLIADQDDYTLALADSGGMYYHVSGSTHTLTIPANASVAFPIGTQILIINENGGGNLSIAITSDTLRWESSTGTRTLVANGVATLTKCTSTVWRLTGTGIS